MTPDFHASGWRVGAMTLRLSRLPPMAINGYASLESVDFAAVEE
jgi:hypothetical protein